MLKILWEHGTVIEANTQNKRLEWQTSHKYKMEKGNPLQ